MSQTSRMREALDRQRQAARQIEAVDLVKPAPPAKEKPARKPKEPAERVERVTVACGHEVPVASLRGLACHACRAAGRQSRAAKHRERAERLRAEKEARHVAGHGRLPHGSGFDVRYDAPAVMWSGTLVVPGVGVFEGTAPAVFELLARLDRMYREAAPAAPAPAPEVKG